VPAGTAGQDGVRALPLLDSNPCIKRVRPGVRLGFETVEVYGISASSRNFTRTNIVIFVINS